jgi:hypothetical protein
MLVCFKMDKLGLHMPPPEEVDSEDEVLVAAVEDADLADAPVPLLGAAPLLDVAPLADAPAP